MRQVALVIAVSAALAGCGADRADLSHHASARASIRSESTMPVVHRASAIAGYADHGDLVAYTRDAAIERGASTWHPVQMSEARALRAIAEGGMVIQAPDGHPIQLNYAGHVEHENGNWSWVGRPQGSAPGTEAVITFGEKAVFGTIPNGTGEPLQITTVGGRTYVVESDPRKLSEPTMTTSDALIPHLDAGAFAAAAPRAAASPKMAGAAPVASTAAATAAAMTTVDVVVGYTNGFAARLGGQSQAITRLQHLVDIGNQAYIDSQVAGRIRMVSAIQVNYTDASSNQDTLFQLSGMSCVASSATTPRTPDTGATCSPSTVPAALQPLVAARQRYGADLVTLVRNFNDPENGSCGVGWLIGAGQRPITAADAKFGVSIVSDSNGNAFPDNGITCREVYLVHELGHNMGLQHDRTTAAGNDDTNGDSNGLDPEEFGAFPYAFGQSTDATHGNFYTIMSLRRTGQTGYTVFSNPSITSCGGLACGVADQEDNARALRQTMPIIASFANPHLARADFNGDGISDLLWRNNTTGADVIWKSANSATSQSVAAVNTGWKAVGVGDFDGDGQADILWRNSSTGANAIWRSGNFSTSIAVARVANLSFVVAGVGDFDGDGHADILWRNNVTGANTIWKSGNAATAMPVATVATSWKVAGVGDFNGDGQADILWRNSATGADAIWRSGNVATSTGVTRVANLSFVVAGVGDFDGDGRADILWRNTATGADTIWKSGNSATPQAVTTVAVAWKVAAVGDYNGDGVADILWRNSATGANAIWRSANVATSQAVTGVTNLAWTVIP